MSDISSNKNFIRHLQSVDYSILLANAPAQWPTPPIKSGYNGVFCTDSGVDIVTQNFLPLNIGTPSMKKLKTEKYLLEMAQQQQAQQLQKTIAQVSPNQIKHNTIVANPVVVGAINAMENLDDCTLWWIVQWGSEYLARFKASATKKELDAHEQYKTWTQQDQAEERRWFYCERTLCACFCAWLCAEGYSLR